MFEERTFVKKKTKAELGKPELINFDGNIKLSPVVEAGALIADYAEKDDEISSLWFKPLSLTECAAVIDYHGNGKRIANNIHNLIVNNYPDVNLTLYSAHSDAGKKLSESARNLYRM